MIEITMYSAIGDSTHFVPTTETPEQRLHTPHDQALFLKNRIASAMRDSEIPARESTSGAGSLSLILDSPLTPRQIDLFGRYFEPASQVWHILRVAGAIA